MNARISRQQIALVHIAKHRLGLTEDAYRDILTYIGGAETSRDLDSTGFAMVMDHLALLGFQSEWRTRNLGERPGMATPAQVSLIRNLWREYTDGSGNDLSLGKWLDRTFGVSAMRFVSKEQAPKIITALKAMKGKKRRKAVPA